ncbi:MAG: DUF1559 domain-containing protein [Planctomycetaceae bacterium]|nr:DUF1559 domain-containing protein [Planctomycetaceae bacterium]
MSRLGVTLLEVLVVIAILSLLMALMIPAVQAARETSRRAQCLSQLHQIGIAVHNYQASFGVFPSTGAWFRQLAPYLDVAKDAKRARFYACPSDESATGSHSGMFRSYLPCDGVRHAVQEGFAAPHLERQTAPRDFVDGLSNTAAFAEKLAWPSFAPTEVPHSMFQETWRRRVRNILIDAASVDQVMDECQHRPQSPNSGWHVSAGYTHVMTPNQDSCYSGIRSSSRYDFWAITSTSAHPGGVNLLYVDGRTSFTSDGVDLTVWRAIGTRNGNESESF